MDAERVAIVPVIVEKLSDGTWRARQGSSAGPIVSVRHPADFCYICERSGADSDEHVVARCFFGGTVGDSEGPHLRTHACCNQWYSAPEEYVAHRVAGFDAATGRAAEAVRASALSAYDVDDIKKGEAQRHAKGKRARHWRELRRSGNVLLWIPEETDFHRWQAVFFKIVRGWVYWGAGLLLRWPAEAAWEIHVPYEGKSIDKPNMRLAVGDGFKAIAQLALDEEGRVGAAIFDLTFYRGVPTRVAVNPLDVR